MLACAAVVMCCRYRGICRDEKSSFHEPHAVPDCVECCNGRSWLEWSTHLASRYPGKKTATKLTVEKDVPK